DHRDLELPAGQVQWGPWGADVGHEAVEIAVHLVLGEVDVAVDRVHRRGLMLEYPQRRAGNGRAQALGVALEDAAVGNFLAGQPAAPGGGAAGAIVGGAGADGIAVHHLPPRVEAQRPDAAGARGGNLGIGDIDPATVRHGKGGTAIRLVVPAVVTARRGALAAAGQ